MKNYQGIKFGIILLLIEFGLLLGFVFLVDYESNIDAAHFNINDTTNIYTTGYSYFQDVQAMMFLGFGFLMVFMKRYGYSSVGFNFLLCTITIQWAILMQGLTNYTVKTMKMDMNSLLKAEFTTAAILVSFGAVLGKLSPLQYLLMAMVEVPIQVYNEYLGRNIFFAIDAGDSIYVHTFAAYFGLGVAWIITLKAARHNDNEGSRYNSDLFAMLGTMVLWIYWPSFNAATAVNDAQQRAVINTVLSLTASTIIVFVVNALIEYDEEDDVFGKFNMVYIQNATLAGGVGIGAAADLMIKPWGALIVGSISGLVSVFGYRFLTPMLTKINLHDSCGVHNLHGLPGLVGGFVSAAVIGLVPLENYGTTVSDTFPVAKNRTIQEQSLYQLAALGSTVGIALVSGILLGILLRFIDICNMPKDAVIFNDRQFWNLPEKDNTLEIFKENIYELNNDTSTEM